MKKVLLAENEYVIVAHKKKPKLDTVRFEATRNKNHNN